MTVHIVTVDSRDRDMDQFPAIANYRVFLPRIYRRVVAARLLTAELPSSFYVFRASAGNTTLPLRFEDDGQEHTAVIPEGNYDADGLCATLEDALNDISQDEWTVRIHGSTMRMTVANGRQRDFTVGPWTSPKKNTEWGLGYYMGFGLDVAYASVQGILTAPYAAQLNPINYLMLDIEELNGIDESGTSGGKASFCKIPVQVDSFQYNFLDTSKLCMPKIQYMPELPTLDRLRVRLRYHDGQLVDFRGVEHSFTLELHTRDPGTPLTNTGSVLADAASSAAASAAAAAVTATHLTEKRHRAEERKHLQDLLRAKEGSSSSLGKHLKKHGKWLVVAALALFYAYIMYKKRTPPSSVPPVPMGYTGYSAS